MFSFATILMTLGVLAFVEVMRQLLRRLDVRFRLAIGLPILVAGAAAMSLIPPRVAGYSTFGQFASLAIAMSWALVAGLHRLIPDEPDQRPFALWRSRSNGHNHQR